MDLIDNEIIDPINHWYYRTKFDAIHEFIPIHRPSFFILDIGAGTADFSKELLRLYPKKVKVLAIDQAYDVSTIAMSNTQICFAKESFFPKADVYLLNDILEHIEEDEQFLGNCLQNADQDSIIVVTVPCFKLLWSQHDVDLLHKRRYSKKSLFKILQNCDLEIVHFRFLYISIFPVALISRFLKLKNRLKNHNTILNSFLILLGKVEARYLKKLPFGINCLVVCRKK